MIVQEKIQRDMRQKAKPISHPRRAVIAQNVVGLTIEQFTKSIESVVYVDLLQVVIWQMII